MYNIRNGAIQHEMHDFLFDGKYSNVCSLTIYEIYTNKLYCQMFDLENEDQGQGGENWTCIIRQENVRFYLYR